MIDGIRAIRNLKFLIRWIFQIWEVFKNPIMAKVNAISNHKLKDLKHYEMPNEMIKFSAGEMLDRLSLKGMKIEM